MEVSQGQHFIMAGEILVSDKAVRMRTTLGSCIALVAWLPNRKVGGMCHYLLPSVSCERTKKSDFYYGDKALDAMRDQLQRYGPLNDYQLWLVGGGSLMGKHQSEEAMEQSVAKRNIQFALTWLNQNKLRPVEAKVGGALSRTVSLDVVTGQFALKEYAF